MRGNIKPFDNTKQYIQATKRQGQVSVLPELDGSKLINLPTVQSSSKLNYLLFRIPKIENDTEYYNFYIQFSNDGTFNDNETTKINTTDDVEKFSIFTGGTLAPLGEIYVSSSSGDDVTIIDNTSISVYASEQILQLDISSIDKNDKYFRFQWKDKYNEGGRYGYGNIQAGGIQIFDAQFQVEISQKLNNVLKIEDDGLFVDGSQTKINKLLFRIPVIQNVQEIYHLKVQFSTTGDFENVEPIDTINDYSKFKIFDGTGTLKQFPIDKNEKNEIESVGITSVYSDEQIQLDISSINEKYKYFRFQWSNDGGDSYGRYGYGNTQALQSIFDITSVETNVINSNKQILFTHQDSDFVSWNVDGTVATFTHNMNCIPITTIYDGNLEQVLYGIKIIDGNSFSIDFKESLQIQNTKPWRIIINYGVNFNIQ